MKKIISFLLVTMILLTCAACAQKEETDLLQDFLNSTTSNESESNSNEELEVENKQESEGEQTHSEDMEQSQNVIENSNTLSILNLKPTQTTINNLQFTLANGLGVDTDLTVLKNDKCYYSYLYESLPRNYNTWKELKNIKFKNISKSSYSNNYTISLMEPSGNISGMYDSYIVCVFDVNNENMTVGEAYENKMYHYVLATENDQYYEKWMNELAFKANCNTAFEAIIKTIGMPSSVHYTDFQNHATFDIVYKLKDKALIFTGYEKFEDYTDDKDRLVIQSIAISGINSTNYLETIKETDTRTSLK